MRAATLTQPWCGLMAARIKRIENRSQPFIRRDAIGSDIAFHASREIDESVYARIRDIAPEVEIAVDACRFVRCPRRSCVVARCATHGANMQREKEACCS